MAKKKATRRNRARLPVKDTVELAADPSNPRTITERAAGGLAQSLKRFGDLSGIVYNRRTEQLVCGHQRLEQIRAEFGDLPIETIDAKAELGIIRADEEKNFSVRVVDWSESMQRAANVAANNQKIAGQFTDDLSEYLTEITEDLPADMLGDLLLSDFIEPPAPDLPAPEPVPAPSYRVIVETATETEQRDLLAKLKAEGWKPRALTL